jgi:hypothetical protein
MAVENLILSEDALAEDFKKFALDAGWPQELINQITIKFDGEDINFVTSPEAQPIMEALEYGGMDSPANSAIRRWTATLDKPVSDTFAQAYLDAVISEDTGF